MAKKLRNLLTLMLCLFVSLQPLAHAGVTQDQQDQAHIAVKHFLLEYSQVKNLKQLESLFSANRSASDQRDIAKMFQRLNPQENLPKMSLDGNTLIISGFDEPIHIDISSLAHGRFVVDGVPVTIDGTAPFKMQTEILMRKLEEGKRNKKSKFSLISLLVPEAQAAGKISGLRKGLNTTAKLAKEAEAAGAAAAKADAEAAAKVNEKKQFWKNLMINGTVISAWEFLRGAGFAGLQQFVCEKKAQILNIQPTPEAIQEASFCKGYLDGLKKALDQSKAETEKSKKEDPKIGAANTLEGLQKNDLQGISLFNGWKVCPFQNPNNVYRSGLTIITEDPASKEKKADMDLVEAQFDGNKLKQMQLFESTSNGPGKVLGTYIPDGEGNLSIIRIKNPKYDPDSKAPEPPEMEIKVTRDNSNSELETYKKLHTQIYGKVMLSIASCADEAKNLEGQRAAQGAKHKVTPKSAPAAATTNSAK